MKVVKGTFQPARAHPPTVSPIDGTPVAPKWLKGAVLRMWNEKVAIYNQRGQSVRGLEGALAQYCALEAELISSWKRGVEIPVARINAHRIYANEFYDTPASQQGTLGGQKPQGGRFSGNGRRPTP